MAYVNSYLLDSRFGTWKDSKRGHREWREALVSQLFNAYTLQAKSWKRGWPGRFDDRRNDSVQLSLHQEGNRGKRAPCIVCDTVKKKARKPFSEASSRANALVGSNIEGSNMEGSNIEGSNLRAKVRGPNTVT